LARTVFSFPVKFAFGEPRGKPRDPPIGGFYGASEKYSVKLVDNSKVIEIIEVRITYFPLVSRVAIPYTL
jgi:hypothetical protein